MTPHPELGARALLRHLNATLAYRAAKVLRDAPASFADARVSPTSRSASDILRHMGDLFDWALTMARGETQWVDAEPRPWEDEVARFFDRLTQFDRYLESDFPIPMETLEKLARGPVADALSHNGQLAMMRRVAGAPVRGESYARADIVTGRTGLEQAAARWEFD